MEPPLASQPQPFSAIQPAWEQTAGLLFRPFRLERWLLLGFLCLLQTCAGIGFGGGSMGVQVPMPPFGGGPSGTAQQERGEPAEPAASPAEELREAGDWLRRHLALIVVVAATAILFVLGLIVLFQWLGSRAVFCYLDALLTGRDEVARPWREHAALAASFFRARLLLVLAMAAGVVGFMVPIALMVLGVVRQQTAPGGLRELWPIFIAIPALLLWLAVLVVFLVVCGLVDLFLYDFVAPLQYRRRIACGAACRAVWALVRAQPVAFLLYLVMKLVVAVALGMVAFAAMCLTCCCAALPYFGQVILQPVHAFHRLLPLHFLRQFGREYDLISS